MTTQDRLEPNKSHDHGIDLILKGAEAYESYESIESQRRWFMSLRHIHAQHQCIVEQALKDSMDDWKRHNTSGYHEGYTSMSDEVYGNVWKELFGHLIGCVKCRIRQILASESDIICLKEDIMSSFTDLAMSKLRLFSRLFKECYRKHYTDRIYLRWWCLNVDYLKELSPNRLNLLALDIIDTIEKVFHKYLVEEDRRKIGK